MSIQDQIPTDLLTVFADWAVPVTFTAPTGAPPVIIVVQAIVNRTTALTDLATGERVPGKRSGLTVRLADLMSMPGDGWKVEGSDQEGAFTLYVNGDPMPDRSMGIVSINLRE